MPVIVYAQSERWRSLGDRVDDLIASEHFRAVKNQGRTLAGFCQSEGCRFFLKRFEGGSWIEGLVQRARGSRAARSLINARLLGREGFLCPEIYAVCDRIEAASVRASYLLTAALADAMTLSRFIDRRLDRKRREPGWRRRVLGAVAREVKRLHDAGIASADLQETNLMLEESEQGLRVYFVDLDGFRLSAKSRWRDRARNLVQLDRSVGRFGTRAERLRFLYTYLDERPDRIRRHEIVRGLLESRRRKDAEYFRRRALRDGPMPRGSIPEQSSRSDET
ncbi:MAG TPA: lipopolysaccharide kinase InaA family protein [Candidatus Binataceae bacterium]|jgi:tRNA A-37 threonylcarbamoyl transferase component Bud32